MERFRAFWRSSTAALSERDFRLLWIGQTGSYLGDALVGVALAFAVLELTGSAADLGLVFAAFALPRVLFTLAGGVWSDRLPRQRVMVACDLVRAGAQAVMSTLLITGNAEIWQLMAFAVVMGSAAAFFMPASIGLMPQIVGAKRLQEANALMSISQSATHIFGPLLSGLIVATIGAGWAFAIDGASFLVSAAFLIRVRPRRRSVAETVMPRATVWLELRQGFREVRARSWVWATLLAFCVALFVGFAPWAVLGPTVATEQYSSIGFYGLVTAALGAGTIAGSLIGIRWRPRHPMRLAMLAILLWPVAMILFAAGVTLVVVTPAFVIAGAGVALFDVWWLTALAERIPADKLSRVTSYDWMVSLGLMPLGYLLAGPLAGAFGAEEVLLGGSAVALLALAMGLLPAETRMLERIDGEPVEIASGA